MRRRHGRALVLSSWRRVASGGVSTCSRKTVAGNLDWGMAGSPLVTGGLVVVNPGNQKGSAASRTLVAYDAATGKRVWGAGGSKGGYAVADAAERRGTFTIHRLRRRRAGRLRRIVADRVVVRSVEEPVRNQRFATGGARRRPVHHHLGRRRRVRAGEPAGWCVRGGSDLEKQQAEGYYASPIVYEGHVYGIDDTLLACLDVATGRQKWKARSADYGHGQLLRRGDLLLILSEAGELRRSKRRRNASTSSADSRRSKARRGTIRTLAGNRILVRNAFLEMAAYDLPVEAAGAR